MKDARRLKVSISIAADVLSRVDREVRRRSDTRSGVIDAWLRASADRQARDQLVAETASYYRDLPSEVRDEDSAWADFSASAFEELGGQRLS
jgi:hypothetical protein